MAVAVRATIWPKDSKPETEGPVEVTVEQAPARNHVELTLLNDAGTYPRARLTLSYHQARRLTSQLAVAIGDL